MTQLETRGLWFLPRRFERDKAAKLDPFPSQRLYGNEERVFLTLFCKYKREPQWASNLSHFSLIAFLTFLSDMTYLEQWFSNLSGHQNHLEGLLKHRLLSPTPRVSDSVG